MLRDLPITLRTLSRSPGYALVVMAVLAVGIAANVMAFGFYKAIVLAPIDGVTDASRLHVIGARTRDGHIEDLSYRDFEFIRDHSTQYAQIAGTTLIGYNLDRGADAKRLYGELVTGTYFQVLGVTARSGRTLLPSDDVTIGAHPVVVISDALWRRRFGADPHIVGTSALFNNVPLTIVGVTPPSFHGTIVGFDIDLFVPVKMQARLSGGFSIFDNPQARALFAIARPRPGVTEAAMRAEAEVLTSQLATDRAPDAASTALAVMPIAEWPLGVQTYAAPLVRIIGATALLLLVTVCANVAALVLARCLDRRREIAARLALGATRARIARLMAFETLLLSAPGVAAGLISAHALEPLLQSVQKNALGVRMYFNWSGGSLVAVAILVAVACAVICGVWPALRTSTLDLAMELKDGGGAVPQERHRVRSALVVTQVATAVVLLAGMVLALRSFTAARHADPRFDSTHVAMLTVDTMAAGYSTAQTAAYYDRLLQALSSTRGVERAATMRLPLLMMWDFGRRDFSVEGRSGAKADAAQFSFNIVGGDHFETLRIPIVAGRGFARTDDTAAPRVTVVNETLARRYWGSAGNALGHRVATADWTTGVSTWMTIVGVARDIKYVRFNEPPTPYVYLPATQAVSTLMGVLVRSELDRPRLFQAAEQAIRSLDSRVPILESVMMEDQTSLGFMIYDVAARLLGAIGVAAVCLAALGIYGLVAYSIKQRLREIGIRMAIGAEPRNIRRRFVGSGLRLGLAGVAVGLLITLATARLMQSVLFGVSATDPLSLIVASGSLVLATAMAAAVPAWRASRLDPIVVLRRP